ncbi:MAG: glycosyltransferase family 4 protein [Candidatus Coatesbacteria bacterium]|nr:glycosyltransferase family 4 protein [Candidatus Coatesbacteria bacterium]
MTEERNKPSLLFWGLMGYDRPSTRIRCVNFADQLKTRGYECECVLYRDKYGRQFGHEQMLHLGDRHKLQITRRAYREFKSRKNEIIYMQKAHWHSLAPHLLHRRRGIKIIFDYDDWDLDRSPFLNHDLLNDHYFGSRDETVITWKLVDESVACVAANKELDRLLRLRHPRVYYIPTGPDTGKFSMTDEQRFARAEQDKTIFVWGGNVWGGVMLGNVVFLLNCFSKVYEANRDVVFRLLAWGTYGEAVKALVSTTYRHLPIEFRHFIHPDAMPAYLAKTHVGLLPLQGDDMNVSWLKSKSPTKQFEYMAMEMATVATPLGDVPYIVKDGVNGLFASTEQEFVARMLQLAGDRALRERLGQQARKTIMKDYCLDRLGDKLDAMFIELGRDGLI